MRFLRLLDQHRIIVTALAIATALILALTPSVSDAFGDKMVAERALVRVEFQPEQCDIFGCSEIENLSTRPLRIGRDWCGASSAPSVGGPSCRGSEGDHDHYQWLYPNEHSYEAAWQDTDTYGVLPGCTIAVQRNEDGDEFDPIETFATTDETWFKVVNIEDIDLESYTCENENSGWIQPSLSPATHT
ncbi:MAG: hypothetical protein HOQ05_00665 [Corynebacteriales bacterium]|nr:hypothetical protein [Mycobacteriales bacterium]